MRRFKLPASENPGDFGPQDAVFIALKAYSIGPMLPRLTPLLTPDTAVITAINGIPWWYFCREGGRFDGARIECLDPDGAMIRALDPKHLLGCVVHASAEVIAPGLVHHTSGRTFILGELDGATTPRLQAIGAAIDGAGARSAALGANPRRRLDQADRQHVLQPGRGADRGADERDQREPGTARADPPHDGRGDAGGGGARRADHHLDRRAPRAGEASSARRRCRCTRTSRRGARSRSTRSSPPSASSDGRSASRRRRSTASRR